jgi:hypothetical protein
LAAGRCSSALHTLNAAETSKITGVIRLKRR